MNIGPGTWGRKTKGSSRFWLRLGDDVVQRLRGVTGICRRILRNINMERHTPDAIKSACKRMETRFEGDGISDTPDQNGANYVKSRLKK